MCRSRAGEDHWDAWKQVKQRQGAPRIDGQTIEQFEADLHGQLYKLWNQMSSGSYFRSAVRLVEMPGNPSLTYVTA